MKRGLKVGEWRPWARPTDDPVLQRIVDLAERTFEQALDDVFRQIFEVEGYTSLELRITEARERLSKRNRATLASEGWIS